MCDRHAQSERDDLPTEAGQRRVDRVVEGRIEEKIQYIIDNPPEDDEMPGHPLGTPWSACI